VLDDEEVRKLFIKLVGSCEFETEFVLAVWEKEIARILLLNMLVLLVVDVI
jgi:hypothetical protein